MIERFDGLLLDHDGVVVTLSSMETLRGAAAGAFADVGVPDPREKDIGAIAIRVSGSELSAVADRYGVDPDRLWERREDRIESALRSETEAGRKAPYGDVPCLEDVAVPIGIASNTQIRIVEYVLRTYDLHDLVGTVRAREPTRESLREKKPEPTYLEAAAADLGCSNPLYVGDSESDVVAGRRAGFETVYLRRPHNRDRRLDVDPAMEMGSLCEVVDML